MGSRRTLLRRGKGGRRVLLLALATWGTPAMCPVATAQAVAAKGVPAGGRGTGPGLTARTASPGGRASLPVVRGQVSDTLFLTLDDAVHKALRDSEEMAAARATLAQAESQVTQAVSGALPQVSSNVVYNRAIRTIFDQAAAPPALPDTLIPPAFDLDKPPRERFDLLSGLLIQDFIGALFQGLPFGRKNTYIATFSLAQPLYVGGKVGSALRVARHFQAAANDQVRETEAETIFQVRAAYLTASVAQRLQFIALESRRVAGEHFRQVESFFEAGTASEFDLLRARVDLENRDPVVIQAENGANLALLNLKRLVNIPAGQPVRLVTSLDPAFVEVNEAELARLVMARPILNAAQEAVAMRQEAVKIARADRLPNLMLTGTMGFQGFPDGPMPPGFDNWRKDWSIALALSIPIFDGFRTRGRIDQAQADLKLARVEEAQLREALELQLEGTLAEYRTARAQIQARRQTVNLAERALELAEVRYGSGLSTQLEVSDAALLLDQARVNEVQALFDYVQILAQLERLSGGRMELMGRGRGDETVNGAGRTDRGRP
jgi:outer membrane protein